MDTSKKYALSKEFSMPANSRWIDFFLTMYFGRNYCNFKGRASRKEFWSTKIFEILFFIIPISLIMYIFPNYADYIDLAYTLITLPPIFSLSVRRFHDINMSPMWGLLIIPLLFLPIFKGDREDNRYGKNIYLED